MKKSGKFKRGLTILLLLLLAYVGSVAFSICSYANVNELAKTDAAIVLGAGTWNGKPSPVFAERINHAIDLYQDGSVKKLIFTGGKGKNQELSDSSIARQYAIENSVPREDILIEEKSTITQENIFYAAQIARENQILTVTLVSDPLHMKRAMLMAKDNHLIAYSSPTPSTKYRTLRTKIPFLLREVLFYIGYQVYRLF